MTINYITIRYNVTGAERKRLADYIAGFLGCERKYLGVPSCAYQVGYIEVSRDGAITFDDRADSEEIRHENALLEIRLSKRVLNFRLKRIPKCKRPPDLQ